MSTTSEKAPLYEKYSIETNTNKRLYWTNSTSGAYCTQSTQKSMNRGKIYSTGYFSAGNGTGQALTVKTLGAADISTAEVKIDRVRFKNDGSGLIENLQKCSYVGTWVSCNALWMGSTYQSYLSAEFLEVMYGGGEGSVAKYFGNDRNNTVWRYARFLARKNDTYGQQLFANLVYNWTYETPTANYIIRPLSSTLDYGDTIDKHTYATNIVQSTFGETTVGATVNWDNQATIASDYINISTSNEQKYINFSWPVFNFFESKQSYQEMFASFNSLNSQNIAFGNGLVFEEAEKKAHLKVSVKPSQSGKIIFYKSSTGDANWGGAKANYSTHPKYNCTANAVYSDEFDVESGDLIWVVYLPSTDGYLSDCLATYTVEG